MEKTDDEILKTVQSMLGNNIKIVDREETSSIREEETLLINGIPVTLDGDDGDAIKNALMAGQVPSCDLLNQILYRAGILRQPVHLETSLSVKSTTVKKEEVTIAKNGIILDERTNETKEDNYYSSHCNEIWEPIKTIRTTNASTTATTPAGNNAESINIPNDIDSNDIYTSPSKIYIKNWNCSSSSNGFDKDSVSSLSSALNLLSTSSFPLSSSQPVKNQFSSSLSSNNSNNREASSYFSLGTDKNSSYSSGSSSNNSGIQPIKQNITGFIPSDNDDNPSNTRHGVFYDRSDYDGFKRKNKNCKTILKNASLSCDSGHDDHSISSSYDASSLDELDFHKVKPLSHEELRSYCDLPTIFGTVASDQSPKDNANKRALPQTTTTSSGSSISTIQKKPNDKQSSSSTSSASVPTSSSQQNSDDNNEIGAKKDNLLLPTEENSLVYRDGNLISGPLDALIQHMVPTSDYYPDRSYIFAFLLSARLFIRPYKLLEQICKLCEKQQNFNCKLDSTTITTTTTSNDKNNLDSDNYCNISGLNDTNNCDHHHQHQRYHHQHSYKKDNNGDGGGGGGGEGDGNDEEECCKKLEKFAQHFIQLLAEWMDTFPYDFRDERLMQHVRLMAKKCICIDNNLRKDVSTMLQNLLHRLTVLENYEEFLQSITNGPNEYPTNPILLSSSSNMISNENRSGSSGGGGVVNLLSSTSGTSSSMINQQQQQQHNSSSSGNNHHQHHHSTIYHQGGTIGSILHSNSSSSTSNCLHSGSSNNSILSSIDIGELCPNPTLLAHQLTHIELERLSHIGPEEFVQAFAKENPHLEQSFNDIKKTRNLESYIQWFNRLSYFVATEIVKHCKKKQRVRIVEYWIETARECFNIGNFNSLMAIIAGLNMSPISRLKKTWAKVQSAKFSVLEHQMDPSSNFNSYRSTLKAAMWRSAGATDERERIVIPFFSLLVKDLYFLNEGCSNKLENGHVNFEKFWQLAKQVTEFITWKQVTCPFEKLPKVIMFLYTNQILSENMLALASFECEPPENHEKDRYKCLKSEQQQQQHQQQQQQQQQQYHQQQQHHHHQQQQ